MSRRVVAALILLACGSALAVPARAQQTEPWGGTESRLLADHRGPSLARLAAFLCASLMAGPLAVMAVNVPQRPDVDYWVEVLIARPWPWGNVIAGGWDGLLLAALVVGAGPRRFARSLPAAAAVLDLLLWTSALWLVSTVLAGCPPLGEDVLAWVQGFGVWRIGARWIGFTLAAQLTERRWASAVALELPLLGAFLAREALGRRAGPSADSLELALVHVCATLGCAALGWVTLRALARPPGRTAAAVALAPLLVATLFATPARAQTGDEELARALERSRDPAREVRRQAAEALGRWGTSAGPAAPALLRLADDPAREVREEALRAVGHLYDDTAPEPVLTALGRALADPLVSRIAAEALARIGGPRAASVLAHGLDSPNAEVRRASAYGLASNPTARCVTPTTSDLIVPALLRVATDPDPNVRAGAVAALARTPLAADRAVPAVVRALDDPDWIVRESAFAALKTLGPAAAPAIPRLLQVLEDEARTMPSEAEFGWFGREAFVAAAEALGAMGSRAASAVPTLVRLRIDAGRLAGACAGGAACEIGRAGKREGAVLWWVVPRVYWRQTGALLCALVVWFALAARVLRRSLRRVAFPARVVLVALPPTLWVCGAVGGLMTQDWVHDFLPEPVVTALPFPVAAGLSAGFVVLLAAVEVVAHASYPDVQPASPGDSGA